VVATSNGIVTKHFLSISSEWNNRANHNDATILIKLIAR